MPREIRLIDVPYDSGHRGARHGAGPGVLVAAGAADRLAASGADVSAAPVRLPDGLGLENGTSVAVMRAVADEVARTVGVGASPVVLAGNCGVTLGVVAGIGAASGSRVGVLWCDAHGDLQQPHTTASGFFDGMGLAMLTGRVWQTLAASVPGHTPLPDEAAVLVGGHDLDAAEEELIAGSALTHLPPRAFADGDAVTDVLDRLATEVDVIHLHVDLDVLDTAIAPANSYAVPGGVQPEDLVRLAREAAARRPLVSLTVASWDPTLDPQHRMRDTALDLLETFGSLLVPVRAEA
jgi:arginase